LAEPRTTTDIDLLILLNPPSHERIQALVSSLFDSTIIHPSPMVFQGISIWRIVGIRSGQEVVIDFLLADSAYLRTALERRQTVPFGTLQVPMLSIEDLIILKMVAGRLRIVPIWRKSARARQTYASIGRTLTAGKRCSGLSTVRSTGFFGRTVRRRIER
jgi:hypothetical protein